jgi:hypothetical protein
MKRFLVMALCAFFIASNMLAQAGSGVYVGGHIRRERPATVEKLKKSGFTYVILFNVNVEEDGTLTTDGETICKDGQYVFASEQPYYQEDVKALKTWPTAIERIDICIGGWGNDSYKRIRSLVDAEGVGQKSILYRNFRALKEAIPEIDGVNNDDESCYDVTSAVKFHTMMSVLGYKTSVAPYTNKPFWQELVDGLNSARPEACDLVMIQCYDGGAYNNPSDWHLGNIPLHAGRTNYQTDMQASINQMEAWYHNDKVVGGFVWVYNDESWNLNQWAAAMNRIFIQHNVTEPAVTFYIESSFGGEPVSLPVGEYCTAALSSYGLSDKSIRSLQIHSGYKLTTWTSDGFTGSEKEWKDTEAESPRLGAWANRISSLKIEKKSQDTGIDLYPSSSDSYSSKVIYDLGGRRLSDNPILRKGVYIKNRKKIMK